MGDLSPNTAQLYALQLRNHVLPALGSLEAFAMDIGDKDFLLEGNRAFRAELDRFGVKYEFELYEGDHGIPPAMQYDFHAWFERITSE